MKLGFLVLLSSVAYFAQAYSGELSTELLTVFKQEELPVTWAYPLQENPFSCDPDINEIQALLRVKNQTPYKLMRAEIIKTGAFNTELFDTYFQRARSLTHEESVWESILDLCCCCLPVTEEEKQRTKDHELGMKLLTCLNVLHAFEHQKKLV